ncbi:MAG: TonB-dependent receptor [Hyphomonadaceae bacterium]|nr:TonB-dependent receptor [Hyphomonadaceae bacterium]
MASTYTTFRHPILAACAWAVAPIGPAIAQEAPAEINAEAAEGEADEIIVQATRSKRRVQDETIRVEVLTREEIEEKLLMRPGNISMILNETGGVRMQVTSPALGAANVRVQGLNGRYTQILSDGLPLQSGQASSLSVLQIAPTDLRQVEVIKGSASALYGGSALGGVINLVSRRPGERAESEFLLNATTRDGQDLTAFGSTPLGEGLALSMTGGLHAQEADDLDSDGWADIPGYDRWTARPRLFWDGAGGASAFLTLGAVSEDREGGALPGRTTPDGLPFPQTQKTDRYDVGLSAEFPIEGLGLFQVRAAGLSQKHRHRFGAVTEDDRHETQFAETSLAGDAANTNWVIGLAYQEDRYRSDTFSAFDYTFRTPGAFAQVEHDLADDLTIAASARYDDHNRYGAQFSPRLSVLYRPEPWTIRASVGGGYYAPTPFVEEIEAAGLARLEPLSGLEAETAETGSLDVGYARGPVEANVTVFAANLRDTTRLETSFLDPVGDNDRVRLVNVKGETRLRGAELLLRYRWRDLTTTGSYVFIDSSEPDPSGAGRRDIPLTPRHTGGLVIMWERHGEGRIGLETYYTGRQALEDNPYRTHGSPYVHMGLLAERVLGPVRLFVNAENLLDVRQTDRDPLLLPQRAPDGKWTVDVWQPTEGFVLNAGVRLKFGAGEDH